MSFVSLKHGLPPIVPHPITILSHSYSPNLEHLTIRCNPFYLPQEFTSFIITAVCIPPQADTDTALSALHDTLNRHQNKYPDAALIIVGDFNKANLKRSCQTSTKISHASPGALLSTTTVSSALATGPLLCLCSVCHHTTIFPILEYKEMMLQEKLVLQEVRCWTAQSEAMLKDALGHVSV